MAMMLIGGDNNMTDEFTMYILVPIMLLVIAYIYRDDDNG